MKKKAVIIIAIVFLVFAVVLVFGFVLPFPNEAERIEIQNGTTGEVFVIQGDEKNEFLNALQEIDISVSGFRIWTSGYEYMIKFIDGSSTKEVYVKNSNLFTGRFLIYKSDTDIIKLIENIMSKHTEN